MSLASFSSNKCSRWSVTNVVALDRLLLLAVLRLRFEAWHSTVFVLSFTIATDNVKYDMANSLRRSIHAHHGCSFVALVLARAISFTGS